MIQIQPRKISKKNLDDTMEVIVQSNAVDNNNRNFCIKMELVGWN